jgi:hypothetical protein
LYSSQYQADFVCIRAYSLRHLWVAIYIHPKLLKHPLIPFDKKKGRGQRAEGRRKKRYKPCSLWAKKIKIFFARCVAREKMRPYTNLSHEGKRFPECLLPNASCLAAKGGFDTPSLDDCRY